MCRPEPNMAKLEIFKAAEITKQERGNRGIETLPVGSSPGWSGTHELSNEMGLENNLVPAINDRYRLFFTSEGFVVKHKATRLQ